MKEDKAQGALEMLRWQLKGTNINGQTLLATDYLNHFNELIMFIEMIPDMPDMMAEARAWAPKSYQQHFLDSNFRDKVWAVMAYEMAPLEYRKPFDQAISTLDNLVPVYLDSIDAAVASNDQARLRDTVAMATRNMRALQDAAAANINGSSAPLSQDKIDDLMQTMAKPGTGSAAKAPAAADGAAAGLGQADIDSLFD